MTPIVISHLMNAVSSENMPSNLIGKASWESVNDSLPSAYQSKVRTAPPNAEMGVLAIG